MNSIGYLQRNCREHSSCGAHCKYSPHMTGVVMAVATTGWLRASTSTCPWNGQQAFDLVVLRCPKSNLPTGLFMVFRSNADSPCSVRLPGYELCAGPSHREHSFDTSNGCSQHPPCKYALDRQLMLMAQFNSYRMRFARSQQIRIKGYFPTVS
jgi:hypothetical protein